MNRLTSYLGGQITQGSIVEGVKWSMEEVPPLSIVLSSPCDLEHSKASFVLLSLLVPAKEVIQNSVEFHQLTADHDQYRISKTRGERLVKYLSAFIHNANITRYFLIDPADAIEAPVLLIDFQCLITIEIEKIGSLNIVASLASPEREKMISHFGSYVSRIGVDRMEAGEEYSIASQLMDPYFYSR